MNLSWEDCDQMIDIKLKLSAPRQLHLQGHCYWQTLVPLYAPEMRG